MTELTLVTGAGGFIGGQLVRDLSAKGVAVRAVDKKPVGDWYYRSAQAENLVADLQLAESCDVVTKGVSHVYNLAADMGGMGFIENNQALCMLSVLINTHMLMAAKETGVQRFFYASSACVYNADKQRDINVTALKEADAYPAMPEDGYGWEKLFSERMCRHFREDFGTVTRVARFHNVYGPLGTWDGGREKAPAAICRKVSRPNYRANMKSKSGAMANKPAVSCILMIVSKASKPSSPATLWNRSIWAAASWFPSINWLIWWRILPGSSCSAAII